MLAPLLTYTTIEDIPVFKRSHQTSGNVRTRFEVHIIDKIPHLAKFENDLRLRLDHKVAANVA
jgi:hypothetical protein